MFSLGFSLFSTGKPRMTFCLVELPLSFCRVIVTSGSRFSRCSYIFSVMFLCVSMLSVRNECFPKGKPRKCMLGGLFCVFFCFCLGNLYFGIFPIFAKIQKTDFFEKSKIS